MVANADLQGGWLNWEARTLFHNLRPHRRWNVNFAEEPGQQLKIPKGCQVDKRTAVGDYDHSVTEGTEVVSDVPRFFPNR